MFSYIVCQNTIPSVRPLPRSTKTMNGIEKAVQKIACKRRRQTEILRYTPPQLSTAATEYRKPVKNGWSSKGMPDMTVILMSTDVWSLSINPANNGHVFGVSLAVSSANKSIDSKTQHERKSNGPSEFARVEC